MERFTRTVTPYLMERDADGLVEFLKRAFAAEEMFRNTGTAGGTHIEVAIGDSVVMVGGGEGFGDSPPANIHLYVEDADATYRKALDAGANSIEEPEDKPDGDRRGGVIDPFGNNWFVAESGF